MMDAALLMELTETLGKSLTFKDIEAIGVRMFGDDYSTHRLEGVPSSLSIAPLTAARRLVAECERSGRVQELIAFVVQLEGNLLNGRTVELANLENFLFHLSQSGLYFDPRKRRLVELASDREFLPDWGALKEGKEYPIVAASIDICDNSQLVRKYSERVMERVYYGLWEYLRGRLLAYEGRIWSWAGDGGLLAFRYRKDTSLAVLCGLEILLGLVAFNLRPRPIKDDVIVRIGMDAGAVKFASDTGRIVSDVVNYAAHLEKKATPPWGLSISNAVYAGLGPELRRLFPHAQEFEGRSARSLVVDPAAALRGCGGAD